MLKKYIIILSAIIILFLLSYLFVFRNPQGTQSEKDGYVTVNSVSGVSFQMHETLLDRSTALTQISNDSNLDASTFYLFKDGEEKYIFFNLEKIVVLAQRGTKFGFHTAQDMETALENASICNIWFQKSGKELEIEEKQGNYYANVNGQITITKELYGDFTGRLVSVNNGKEEWSIFAGIPGSDYEEILKEDREIIETITSSLTVTVPADEAEPSGESQDFAEESLPKEEQNEVDAEVAAPATHPVPEDKTSGIGEMSNQKEKVAIGDAYESDVYSLLDIGERGILSAYSFDIQAYEEPIIKIEKVYSSAGAIQLIKETLKDQPYTPPRQGCTYHAVEYSIDYSNCTTRPYVNIKVRGMDGDVLKYRGIKYSKKTFDILDHVTQEEPVSSNYICYYEVPNGCKEYVLECGDGTIHNNPQIRSAYVKIIAR